MTDLPKTTDKLRAEIDSGRSGDKNDFPDPAMSPLGTDDEAAGTPPSPAQIREAAEAELRPHRNRVNATGRAVDGFPWPYLAICLPLLAIILFVVWLAVKQRVD